MGIKEGLRVTKRGMVVGGKKVTGGKKVKGVEKGRANGGKEGEG